MQFSQWRAEFSMELWFDNFLFLVYSSKLPPGNDISNDAGCDENVTVSLVNIKDDSTVLTETLSKVTVLFVKEFITESHLILISDLLQGEPGPALVPGEGGEHEPLVPVLQQLGLLNIKLELVLGQFSCPGRITFD